MANENDDDDPQLTSILSSWSGPRTLIIPKTEQGYGFTLRHFIVYPPESALQEENLRDNQHRHEDYTYRRPKLKSLEPMDTIFVKNVKEDSPAYHVGLTTGDRVLSVNGVPVTGRSYAQVIALIQSSDNNLKLEVLPQDEDILQMAYRNTSYHGYQQDSFIGSNSDSTSVLRVKGQPRFKSQNSVDSILSDGSVRRERKMSATSSMDELSDTEERKSRFAQDRNRRMRSSTSYTSGMSIYTNPKGNGREMSRNTFIDKQREFENLTKENTQNKTYTFGLFYPSPSKENRTDGITSSSILYRQSKDNVLKPNDSQENISRMQRVIPLEKRQQSDIHTRTSARYSPSSTSPSRHSYPDYSLTNQNLAVQHSHVSPQNTVTPIRQKSEFHTTRHYVPVVSQSPILKSSKMSASADNLDDSNYKTRIYRSPNQSDGPQTFIVKIGDKNCENVISPRHSGSHLSTTTVQVPNYGGTAFALTRSPVETKIEIKANERPIVSHMKNKFETVKSDGSSPGSNANRYKSELKKIQSSSKFSSVASRLANFERDSHLGGKSGYNFRRMSSTDHYSSPEPSQSPHSQSNPNIAQYQESAPIRIYVSQGNSDTPSSPIVEIVNVYQDNVAPMETSSQELRGTPLSNVHQDEVDGHFMDHKDFGDDTRGQKPVRKPSFLAAVTSQQKRDDDSSQGVTTMDSPPPNSWMNPHVSMSSSSINTMTSYTSASSAVCMPPPSSGVALTSTPKDTKPPVKLRKKSETSPEDEAIKLQRRTSYLMATANDRDTHKLSLNTSVSPTQSDADFQMITPDKRQQQSIRKIKHFFGEKTPRISEALSEKHRDPASPLQEVVREGTLYCKVDVTDGKKSSDRSWKPVWVELRGHCLYLYKDKKDSSVTHPFSFEDQPVSIKSCLVDIAYDYTKKKNVFRLKTFNSSEYLFQADDQESMMAWIDAIKEHNNPDSDDKGVMITENIRMNIQHEQQSTTTNKTSPQPLQKSKKLSSISLKPKVPQSPNAKRKKTEDKDSKDSNKSRGIRHVIKSFRKGTFGSSSSGHIGETEVTGMFGVPLECCIPSPNNDFVPMIVDLCTKIVEARGLEVTGVYRVPGNTAAVNMMQEELNKGIDNMNVDHEKWCDVNVISSLLKAFFRKLPDPLITSELYEDIITANKIEDQERRMLKLKRLLHKLPEHHFETFRHLAEHLNRVASNGHLNKMDARNLAMMFGPNLVRKGDNDMAALVKDMSDQCRIVETVIQHYDWFFSSWDQDSYVPVDDHSDEGAPSIPSVSKMSCDEDDNTVNPRDIVLSIVQAANKKLQHKGKSLDELDAPVAEGVFNERNIDQEILRHNRMKAQIDSTSRSSPNLSAMSRSSQEQIVKVRQNAESTADRRMAKSQEIIDTDFSNWDFEKERQSQGPFSKNVVSRHYSEDSLDKNDELEISHGLSNSFSLSRDTIDSLRRIEEEARTLREKEEKRRRDHEKRKLEWQRVEQDIQRTQKEIEIEDSHSVEDLLNVPSYMWHSSSDIFNRLASGKMDSESLASDYSNTSSSGDSRVIPSRLKYGSMSDYSSSTSPTIIHDRDKYVPGGKYFVIQSKRDKQTRQKPLQGSVESIETLQSKRTNSLETMLEDTNEVKMKSLKSYKIPHKQKRDHRHRHVNRDSSESNLRGSRGNLSRSNSMRRGSLDSLIDLYDKHDGRRMSVGSSDSEDGSDLLSDLTSTFDQKLQILVNPKYKLTGSATRLNKSEGTTSNEREVTAQFKLPPQVPLSQINKFGLCNSSDRLEKEFRDPSLHRTPLSKTEAKVGIASRFERSPSNISGLTQNSFSNGSFMSNSSHIPMTSPLVSTEARTSSVMVVLPSPITVLDSKPKSSRHYISSSESLLSSNTQQNGNFNSKNDNHPVSKFEKTEVNFTKKGKETTGINKPIHIKSFSADSDNPRISSTGHSKERGSRRVRSPSPQPTRRKEKRTKRRHTVGGTDDREHFKALMTLQLPKEEPRLSAWEQLQPVVKDANLSASSSMLSWLRNERLRGSSPDLSVVPNHSPKFF